MEDNNTNIVEFEETNNSPEEIEETNACESSSGGVIAGVVGGFIAYVVIDGAKKLWSFIAEKRAEKKRAKVIVVDAEGEDSPQPDEEEQ